MFVGPIGYGVEDLLDKKKLNMVSLVAAASVLGGRKPTGLHAVQAQARELLRVQYNAFRSAHQLGRKHLKKVPVTALEAGCPIRVLNWPAGRKSTFKLAAQIVDITYLTRKICFSGLQLEGVGRETVPILSRQGLLRVCSVQWLRVPPMPKGDEASASPCLASSSLACSSGCPSVACCTSVAKSWRP